MKASVMIPSWRRARSLSRCIDALERQHRLPDQLVLVVREEDEETRGMIERRDPPFPLEIVTPPRPGLVAALNTGLDAIDGDFVAITDDDAEPHADWLQRIEDRLEQDPHLGGVGGRDRMPAENGVGWEEAMDVTVGRVLWFGRVVGNHNFGRGPLREVDILKGVNMAFRMSAIGGRRIDTELRGSGAEHHTEVDLCLGLRAAGWRLAYDPAILVDHHEEDRYGGERIKTMSAGEQHDVLHNKVYGLLRHLPPHRWIPAFLYGLLIGTRDDPGLLLAIESAFGNRSLRPALARLRITASAHKTALASRRAQHRRSHRAENDSNA